MNADLNDPRITAYALGELTGEDAVAFENIIAEHPEIAAEVEAIRAMGGDLHSALAAEPVAVLSENARSAIDGNTGARKIVPFRRVLPYLGGSIAAAIAITMLLPEKTDSNARNMAKAEGQPAEEASAIRELGEIHESIKIEKYSETRRGGVLEEEEAADGRKNVTPIQLEQRFGDTNSDGAMADLDNSTPVSISLPDSGTTEQKFVDSFAAGRGATTATAVADKPANIDYIQTTTAQPTPEVNLLFEAAPTPTTSLGIQPAPARGERVQASPPTTYSVKPAQAPEPLYRSLSTSERSRQQASHTIELAKEPEARRTRFEEAYGRSYEPRPVTRETASYPVYQENSFLTAIDHPLSTFSTDVDTASYANVRRFLNEGRLPPEDAVRIEELINYFSYDYPQPKGDVPFSINLEAASAPWNPEHRLVRVALKGKEIAAEDRPSCNLVFLVDVSGSMKPENRLPAIKQGLRFLARELQGIDRVAIVTYANNSGLALPSTSAERKDMILAAIDRLQAGGSTNGGDGIRQAYQIASEHFIKDGVNRVILCTDGDFNVGTTNQNELVDLIKEKARTGIFLSALGVGTDNYKDSLLQGIADNGNGNYHYIDSVEEAHKVLIQQMSANLITIAKDVKIQVEFNPSTVNAYRLIGYEKRMLAAQDFNDDKKDAGEIGAGHTVTALYEVVPAGVELTPSVDGLKYQKPAERPAQPVELTGSREMLTLKLRYKAPDGDVSRLVEQSFTDRGGSLNEANEDLRFAAAVAEFGMILRGSQFRQNANFDSILQLASSAQSHDPGAYRADFINLVQKARQLKERTFTKDLIQEVQDQTSFK